MEQGVQVVAALWFGVVGLSHLVQPQAWVDYFSGLRERGPSGAFEEGFLCLGFGAFVVAFHDVWTWPDALLTVVGWLQVIKGAVRFAWPQKALRLYARFAGRPRDFRAAGVFSLVMAGFFAWLAVR